MGELLADCQVVTDAKITPAWVDADFLRDKGLLETGEIPIWSPTEGPYGKAALVSGERAHARGLKNRPTRETARDTLRWWQALPPERTAKLRAGLAPEREVALLAEWRQSAG